MSGWAAAPVTCRWSSPCHHPTQVSQPGWFRSIIYTLKLKRPFALFAWRSFWSLAWAEVSAGVGDEVVPPRHSCTHSGVQLHRVSVLPSPLWPADASAMCPLLSVAQALLQTQSCCLSKHLGVLEGKSLPCCFSYWLCVCVALVCLCSEKKKSLKCLLTPAQMRETL